MKFWEEERVEKRRRKLKEGKCRRGGREKWKERERIWNYEEWERKGRSWK